MNFAYPQGSIFLLLSFAVAVLAVLALVRKRRALRRLARQGIYQSGILVRPIRQIVNCRLLLFVALLLGIAVLGPQWGWIEKEFPPRRGRDVVIILDVSRSMLAEDVAPNRLERARADLRDLADHLERAGGYRIALITFAERAAVVCPLTSDYRCFAEELADASLKSLRLRGHASWGDGTQIGAALDRADQIIDDDNAAYTDVLLISDGDDMARATLAMTDTLASRGIAVHTLGLGDPDRGSFIPVRDRLGRPAQLHFRGELVSTQLEEEVLQAIAERTHGHYFAVGTGDLELDRAFGALLAGKEKLERQTVHRERHGIHRFQWFVAPALVLLLLQWLLSDARRPGRAALEQPNYFRWVRKRASNPPSRERPRAVLLRALTFAGLTFLATWSLGTSAGPAQPVDPWTAFRRGNELLREAQQAGMKADPAWLIQAQRQYRRCLARQDSTRDAGTLFEDARYNLELAKLLLMQIGRSGTDVGQQESNSPSAESETATSPNDDKDKSDRRSAKRPNTKKQPPQKKKEDQEEREKSKSDPKKNKTGNQKDKTDSGQNKSDNGQNKAKNQSSRQTNQNQQQQQSKGKSGPGSARPTGQKRDGKAQKATQNGKGSPSNQGDPKQKKQTEPQPDDSASKDKSEAGEGTKSSSDRTPADQERKTPSTDDAKGSSGASQGTMPSIADIPAEDEQRGRGRGQGPEPDAGDLFHPETPVEKQKSQTPGVRSRGDSAGGGPSKEKMTRELDPVMQAAVMRLQKAIQRIEKRRGRRALGPAPTPEDPANMKRYRDW